MQSRIFRPTLRQCAPPPSFQKSKKGFFATVVGDSGNYPIIAANIVAASMLIIFSSRKLFFHPDVTIGGQNRFSPEVQNETSTRLDQALVFRGQTRTFARILTGDGEGFSPTAFIMRIATGNEVSDKFKLGFLKKTDIPLPLESTDYFDDGLFVGNKEAAFSANVNNDKDFIT